MMLSKNKKIFTIILIIFLLFISFRLYKDKKSNEWSLKIAEEMFSGPPAKRIFVKDISLVSAANPRVSKNAADLLKYFYALSNNEGKNFVLSGQNIGDTSAGLESISSGYEKYFKALKDKTGKLPTIMGIDYGWDPLPEDYTEINKILIDYWEKGGLIEISMSPSNPFTGKGLRDFGVGNHTYNDLFIQDTDVNKRWIRDLDRIATGLKQLQSAGVVVLWRPLHEMNGDFFWWSYGENGRATKEEYVKLWVHMFNYFADKKGLNNLLWVYAPNATLNNSKIKPVTYYYPGDKYVDIAGLDYYWNDMTKVNADDSYNALVSLKKPVGFTEIGSQKTRGFDNLAIIKAINTKYPQMVFEMHWHGWVSWRLFHTKKAIVENQNAKEFMNDPLIITLDKKVRETKFGSLK